MLKQPPWRQGLDVGSIDLVQLREATPRQIKIVERPIDSLLSTGERCRALKRHDDRYHQQQGRYASRSYLHVCHVSITGLD